MFEMPLVMGPTGATFPLNAGVTSTIVCGQEG